MLDVIGVAAVVMAGGMSGCALVFVEHGEKTSVRYGR
jgi:hypothetical protein